MTVPTDTRQVIGDVLAAWPCWCAVFCLSYACLVLVPERSLMYVLTLAFMTFVLVVVARFVVPRPVAAVSGAGFVYVVHSAGVRSPVTAVSWSQVRKVAGRRTVVVFRLRWWQEREGFPQGLVLARRGLQPGDAARIAQHARLAGVPVTGLDDRPGRS